MTDDDRSLLGVSGEASVKEANRAYRQRVRRPHPDAQVNDTNSLDGEGVQELLTSLAEARRRLLHPAPNAPAGVTASPLAASGHADHFDGPLHARTMRITRRLLVAAMLLAALWLIVFTVMAIEPSRVRQPVIPRKGRR